jgi:DNA gyrase subunit A
MAAADLRQQGRATQGVRLINLRNNDEIASVTRVMPEDEVNLDEFEDGYEGGADGAADASNNDIDGGEE